MSKPSGKMIMAYETIARLESEVAALRDMLADRVIDETKLAAYQTERGGAKIFGEGGAAGILANAFAEQLIESEAPNYIEATFDVTSHPEVGEIVVTIKRGDGLTPHQLRTQAERKLNGEEVCAPGSLQEFINDMRRELVKFERSYMAEHSKSPENYPLAVSVDNAGVWLEQFLMYD